MTELGLTLDQIERLFPRLDELYELHSGFLRSLLALQRVNADRSVDEIGPTLLKQVSWGGEFKNNIFEDFLFIYTLITVMVD